MIRFIIVDSDDNYNKVYASIIKELMFSKKINYDITIYNNYCNNLDKDINDNSVFKIYIIDPFLDGNTSGLSICQNIRKNDWDSEIIIVTSHADMFEMIYRSVIKIFTFIDKSSSIKCKLETILKSIINKDFDKNDFLIIQSKQRFRIYLKDIMYITKMNNERKIVIVTTNNEYIINISLTKALELCDERFKQVHRACIVNTERVNVYNYSAGYFILDNGNKIYLCSKKYFK